MRLYSFFNLGNTCYLNSVLQCFINDPCFKKNCNFELLNNINVDFTINNENINHKHSILDIVNYFNDKFKRFQQHDAHEFLLHLLDILKISYYYGKIKTNTTCSKCKNVSSVYEEFSTINLDNNKFNLIDNFMEYLKKETIDDYKCDICKQNVIAEKKICLFTLPSHLIIVLKNYSLKKEIVYPMIDLKIKETESGKIFNYSLYAIIYHHGNTDFGHYNCNIKINDKWYFIDDETINLVNNIENNNKNSYILFYKIK